LKSTCWTCKVHPSESSDRSQIQCKNETSSHSR
jgi:hypothetical protein